MPLTIACTFSAVVGVVSRHFQTSTSLGLPAAATAMQV